jgi:putative tricarboxylic transport membrane protein
MAGDDSVRENQTGNHRKRIDQVLALVWLALGAMFVIQSRDLQYMAEYGPGPGFLPFWLGVGMTIVGGILLAQVTLSRAEGGDISLPKGVAARQMVLVMAGYFAFVFLSDKIGFILCTGLLFFFLLTAVERKGWKFSLAIAVLNAVIYWTIFELAFEVNLPPGLLELLRR